MDRAIALPLAEDAKNPKGTYIHICDVEIIPSRFVSSLRAIVKFCAERNHDKGDNDEDIARAIQDSLNMNPYMPHNPYAPSQALPIGYRSAICVHDLVSNALKQLVMCKEAIYPAGSVGVASMSYDMAITWAAWECTGILSASVVLPVATLSVRPR